MSLNTLKRLRTRAIGFFQALTRTSYGDDDRVLWITVRNTNQRWEAELLQQVLLAQHIPARVVVLGIGFYMGQGSPAALQVPSDDEQTALNLLEPVDEAAETIE